MSSFPKLLSSIKTQIRYLQQLMHGTADSAGLEQLAQHFQNQPVDFQHD